MYHLLFLAQLHELSMQEQHWLSIDQRLEICGVAGPVSDESCTEPPAPHLVVNWGRQVLVLWGFRGDLVVQPPRPNVPIGVGGSGGNFICPL